MDKFKKFYQSKRGRAICFFTFYLFFFIFVFMYINSNKVEDVNKVSQEMITISDVLNTNYEYDIKINDEGNIINYKGNNRKKDYEDYEYKYFLELVNINKLIKKGKVVSKSELAYNYEISNSVIDEILDTETLEGINIINVENKENEVNITLDLHEYLEKNIYNIEIRYKVMR